MISFLHTPSGLDAMFFLLQSWHIFMDGWGEITQKLQNSWEHNEHTTMQWWHESRLQNWHSWSALIGNICCSCCWVTQKMQTPSSIPTYETDDVLLKFNSYILLSPESADDCGSVCIRDFSVWLRTLKWISSPSLPYTSELHLPVFSWVSLSCSRPYVVIFRA